MVTTSNLNISFKNETTYVVLVIGLSWMIWGLGLIQIFGIFNFNFDYTSFVILNVIGGSVPSIIGLAMIYYTGGSDQVRSTLLSVLDPRNIKLKYLAIIFALLPIINLLSFYLNDMLGGKKTNSILMRELQTNPFVLGSILVIFAINLLPNANSFREEFGWRGFLSNNLEHNTPILLNGVITGLIWGIWHIPLYLFPNVKDLYNYIPLPLFILDLILLSIIMNWIFFANNKSMLSMILFHAILNLTNIIFVNYKTTYGMYLNIIFEFIVVILIYFGHIKSENTDIVHMFS